MGHFKMTRPGSQVRGTHDFEISARLGDIPVVAILDESADFNAPTVAEIEQARPVDRFLTVSDILPPEAIALFTGDDEDGPTSADIESVRTGRPKPELPTRPYDQLLWRAYIRGAEWGADGEYPDWDDTTFYGDQAHGQGMLVDFYDLLEGMRPKQVVANTLCSLGRPLRDHAARCHPECEWRAP